MTTIYQVVTNEGEKYYDEVDLTNKYEVSGYNVGEWARKKRPELYAEYKLHGLNGPMYNGTKDGKTVIRYEEPAHYATYD